jgi:hypothetical protein
MYNLFDTTFLLSRKEVIQLSLFGNSSQLYFDFVYSDYLKEHSEFSYLLDLIDMIDWSVVPDFSNKIGRTGYSRRALLKAIFVHTLNPLRGVLTVLQ